MKDPKDPAIASPFAALYCGRDRAKCENKTKSIQPMQRIHLSVFISSALVTQNYPSGSLLQAGRAMFSNLTFRRLVHFFAVSLWSQCALGQDD